MSVGTIYRTTVSCVPDADLSLNARVHHMARARKARALREFVGWQTREDAPPEPFAVPVLVTVSVGWPKGRKRHDDDNMVGLLKSVIDGMTDAGWWTNDRLVTIRRPIEQQAWSRWERHGGWCHPAGVMVIDVEEVGG